MSLKTCLKAALAALALFSFHCEARAGEIAGSVFRSDTGDFHGAKWISHPSAKDGPYGKGDAPFAGSWCVAKTVRLPAGAIASAEAFVCGLGAYRLFVNGACVDATYLAPGWSEYLRTIRYDRVDLAKFLKAGEENEVLIRLAPGFGADWCWYDAAWRAPERALFAADVVQAGGARTRIVSDGTWRACTDGQVVRASIYGGETRDLRKGLSPWGAAKELKPLGGELVRNVAPPVRARERFAPRRIRPLADGRHLVDFGENIAGFVRLRVRGGTAGDVIAVRQTEEANADLTALDATSNRGSGQCDRYTLAGGDATLAPSWRYSGFRYAEVTGWKGALASNDIEAVSVAAAVDETAFFRCSHEPLNWLWRAARRSMLGCLQTVPTDTPSRDERTCCLMDTHAYWDLASRAFDLRDYSKMWLGHVKACPLDLGALKRQNGLDRVYAGHHGTPDWAGVRVQLPWWLYEIYGDKGVLSDSYRSMAEFLWFVSDHRLDARGVIAEGHGYGDWCAPMAKGGYVMCRASFTNTALYLHLLDLAAKTASVLNKPGDVKFWRDRHAKGLAAFERAFYHPDTATYDDGSQTAGALALAFGLVKEENRPAVFSALTNRIVSVDRYAADTGIFGTKYLAEVLADNGAIDLWVRMLEEEKGLGFGSWRSRGATTLWEQWQGAGEMCTHNHAMFAGAAESLLSRIGGIRPLEPGFRRVLVAPVFPQKLAWAEAEQKTPQGLIRVRWQREGEEVKVSVDLPKGATGELRLPNGEIQPLPSG